MLQFKVLIFVIINAVFSEINCVTNQINYRDDYLKYGKDWIYIHTDQSNDFSILYLNDDDTNVKKALLGSSDMSESITFHLYTKYNINNGKIMNFNNLKKIGFDNNKPTKFVTHGWLSGGNSTICIDIKNNYLTYYDYNVIIVDWSPIANTQFYPSPMHETKDVANYYAKFVKYLIRNGLDVNKLHLIGHSLGAHISGFVGGIIGNQTIARITGLDPAKPGFLANIPIITRGRISKMDAKFVDIIHSCGGVLGLYEPLGHADFYPNNGVAPQPGCDNIREIVEGCSHARSWMYFAESIIPDAEFISYKCNSWWNLLNKDCGNTTTQMGDRVLTNIVGTFYLNTNSKQPFATYDTTLNSI